MQRTEQRQVKIVGTPLVGVRRKEGASLTFPNYFPNVHYYAQKMGNVV